jgi:hypothetical protein
MMELFFRKLRAFDAVVTQLFKRELNCFCMII